MRKNLWVFLILFLVYFNLNNFEKGINGVLVNRNNQSLIENNKKTKVLI